ncbi:unnamed protein product [Tuber aestivum]|uniref:Uncharacterized protein n=1 Tax=Tuber aestivum TaxID=59557 RepID=A0A292Q373_9PEZI|nr:unnamed protein product [Tuber aestivum]
MRRIQEQLRVDLTRVYINPTVDLVKPIPAKRLILMDNVVTSAKRLPNLTHPGQNLLSMSKKDENILANRIFGAWVDNGLINPRPVHIKVACQYSLKPPFGCSNLISANRRSNEANIRRLEHHISTPSATSGSGLPDVFYGLTSATTADLHVTAMSRINESSSLAQCLAKLNEFNPSFLKSLMD